MDHETWVILNRIRDLYPDAFKCKSVFEGGSYHMHYPQKIRDLFEAEEYVGVDWREGEGVDRACLIHEYTGHPDCSFDTVVAIALFEHDPFWEITLEKLLALVKPNGFLLLGWAGPDARPHEQDAAPAKEYYRGRSFEEILPRIFARVDFREMLLFHWFIPGIGGHGQGLIFQAKKK